jgi:hypothetical protein
MTNNRKILELRQFGRICIFAPHHHDTQLRLYPKAWLLGATFRSETFLIAVFRCPQAGNAIALANGGLLLTIRRRRAGMRARVFQGVLKH